MFYEVYGLLLESEIKIELLKEIRNKKMKSDVKISLKTISKNNKRKIAQNKWFSYENNSFCFKIEKLGYYLIENGDTVIIDVEENFNNEDLNAFLLGTALGIILMQRNMISIHGAAVVIDNKSIILTGKMGAGKSTLTNNFLKNNYKFLSDDVSSLKVEENKIFCFPAYPRQKLCEDTILRLNLNSKNYNLVDEDRKKYSVDCNENFLNSKKEISAIVEIVASSSTRIEEIVGEEKLKLIISNIYRIEVIVEKGLKKKYFENILKLASKIRAFRLHRVKGEFNIDVQRKNILEVIT